MHVLSHTNTVRKNAISDERVRYCALCTHSVAWPLLWTVFIPRKQPVRSNGPSCGMGTSEVCSVTICPVQRHPQVLGGSRSAARYGLPHGHHLLRPQPSQTPHCTSDHRWPRLTAADPTGHTHADTHPDRPRRRWRPSDCPTASLPFRPPLSDTIAGNKIRWLSCGGGWRVPAVPLPLHPTRGSACTPPAPPRAALGQMISQSSDLVGGSVTRPACSTKEDIMVDDEWAKKKWRKLSTFGATFNAHRHRAGVDATSSGFPRISCKRIVQLWRNSAFYTQPLNNFTSSTNIFGPFLWPVTFDLWPLTCDLRLVTLNLWPCCN